ncbi:enoyl-CoA hydratase/isomerase family protein [Arsenicicoccus sp. oral taxon 190]|uniref:enoyl-CoA hydratase/isomerase family protein n=1 Tax=Arsenicicoccus sp. oral taxon 190 TaxID=1658671 RepID=UPI00067A2C7F|nr:enoyl-CoA hydratase-related protein [Arsenicicoccus sp. oral taxon 190]AKT51278.1 enoyl-CoA hydratase [Arsenicicoccus sp. oral taxon 190]
MDLGTFETLLVEQDGPALVVTVNRPHAMNALAGQVIADLEGLLVAIETQVGSDGRWPIRGVIVTGAGEKAFVAGADIVEMQSMSPDQGEDYSRRMQGVTRRLEALPVPVIAAVHGFALGGGCELALACDWIYASSSARFGQPEVNLGLVPGFGGSVRLTRRVGLALSRELICTGRMIKAEEALRIGLVNQVFEDRDTLLDGARRTVAELAAKSPVAVAACKQLLNAVEPLSVPEGLDLEARAFHAAFESEDKVEGVRAFVAKTAPTFPGR